MLWNAPGRRHGSRSVIISADEKCVLVLLESGYYYLHVSKVCGIDGGGDVRRWIAVVLSKAFNLFNLG